MKTSTDGVIIIIILSSIIVVIIFIVIIIVTIRITFLLWLNYFQGTARW